jgi:hypothetical protein
MSTKQKVRLPPPTNEELQVQQTVIAAADAQLGVIEQQAALQQKLFEQIPGLFADVGDAADAVEAFEEQGISEQERALLDEAVSNALGLGEADISRFRDEGLFAIRDTLAPGRGLRPDDSPVLNEAANVVREGQIQQGQLVRALRGTAATAEFDRSFDRDQFRAQLQQNAFNNRLGLAGGASSIGLGLNPNVNIPSSLAVIQRPRLAQTSTTVSGAQPISSLLSSTGSFLTGLGDLRTAFGGTGSGGGGTG